jgi:hypothetical protein
MVNGRPSALEGAGRSLQHPGDFMSLSFVIGAVIGSGAFILLGRAPAQKLVEAVQARIGKPR